VGHGGFFETLPKPSKPSRPGKQTIVVEKFEKAADAGGLCRFFKFSRLLTHLRE